MDSLSPNKNSMQELARLRRTLVTLGATTSATTTLLLTGSQTSTSFVAATATDYCAASEVILDCLGASTAKNYVTRQLAESDETETAKNGPSRRQLSTVLEYPVNANAGFANCVTIPGQGATGEAKLTTYGCELVRDADGVIQDPWNRGTTADLKCAKQEALDIETALHSQAGAQSLTVPKTCVSADYANMVGGAASTWPKGGPFIDTATGVDHGWTEAGCKFKCGQIPWCRFYEFDDWETNAEAPGNYQWTKQCKIMNQCYGSRHLINYDSKDRIAAHVSGGVTPYQDLYPGAAGYSLGELRLALEGVAINAVVQAYPRKRMTIKQCKRTACKDGLDGGCPAMWSVNRGNFFSANVNLLPRCLGEVCTREDRKNHCCRGGNRSIISGESVALLGTTSSASVCPYSGGQDLALVDTEGSLLTAFPVAPSGASLFRTGHCVHGFDPATSQAIPCLLVAPSAADNTYQNLRLPVASVTERCARIEYKITTRGPGDAEPTLTTQQEATVAMTYWDCSLACTKDENCSDYSYDPKTKQCIGYNACHAFHPVLSTANTRIFTNKCRGFSCNLSAGYTQSSLVGGVDRSTSGRGAYSFADEETQINARIGGPLMRIPEHTLNEATQVVNTLTTGTAASKSPAFDKILQHGISWTLPAFTATGSSSLTIPTVCPTCGAFGNCKRQAWVSDFDYVKLPLLDLGTACLSQTCQVQDCCMKINDLIFTTHPDSAQAGVDTTSTLLDKSFVNRIQGVAGRFLQQVNSASASYYYGVQKFQYDIAVAPAAGLATASGRDTGFDEDNAVLALLKNEVYPSVNYNKPWMVTGLTAATIGSTYLNIDLQSPQLVFGMRIFNDFSDADPDLEKSIFDYYSGATNANIARLLLFVGVSTLSTPITLPSAFNEAQTTACYYPERTSQNGGPAGGTGVIMKQNIYDKNTRKADIKSIHHADQTVYFGRDSLNRRVIDLLCPTTRQQFARTEHQISPATHKVATGQYVVLKPSGSTKITRMSIRHVQLYVAQPRPTTSNLYDQTAQTCAGAFASLSNANGGCPSLGWTLKPTAASIACVYSPSAFDGNICTEDKCCNPPDEAKSHISQTVAPCELFWTLSDNTDSAGGPAASVGFPLQEKMCSQASLTTAPKACHEVRPQDLDGFCQNTAREQQLADHQLYAGRKDLGTAANPKTCTTPTSLGGTACGNSDLNLCCVKRQACSATTASQVCGSGGENNEQPDVSAYVKLSTTGLYCKSDLCNKQDDRETCCARKETCKESGGTICPTTGLAQSKLHFFCSGLRCTAAADSTTCCAQANTCASAGITNDMCQAVGRPEALFSKPYYVGYSYMGYDVTKDATSIANIGTLNALDTCSYTTTSTTSTVAGDDASGGRSWMGRGANLDPIKKACHLEYCCARTCGPSGYDCRYQNPAVFASAVTRIPALIRYDQGVCSAGTTLNPLCSANTCCAKVEDESLITGTTLNSLQLSPITISSRRELLEEENALQSSTGDDQTDHRRSLTSSTGDGTYYTAGTGTDGLLGAAAFQLADQPATLATMLANVKQAIPKTAISPYVGRGIPNPANRVSTYNDLDETPVTIQPSTTDPNDATNSGNTTDPTTEDPTTKDATTVTATTTTDDRNEWEKFWDDEDSVILAGIVLGVVILLCLLGCVHHRRKAKQQWMEDHYGYGAGKGTWDDLYAPGAYSYAKGSKMGKKGKSSGKFSSSRKKGSGKYSPYNSPRGGGPSWLSPRPSLSSPRGSYHMSSPRMSGHAHSSSHSWRKKAGAGSAKGGTWSYVKGPPSVQKGKASISSPMGSPLGTPLGSPRGGPPVPVPMNPHVGKVAPHKKGVPGGSMSTKGERAAGLVSEPPAAFWVWEKMRSK
ncbi:unnamed protein product [Amoebophrya sp. A120]|nr:unnamed protein product [Amoebophrya sp. A120]|eukprot:GSA120T00004736001.1